MRIWQSAPVLVLSIVCTVAKGPLNVVNALLQNSLERLLIALIT
jgi:hypothetical protein